MQSRWKRITTAAVLLVLVNSACTRSRGFKGTWVKTTQGPSNIANLLTVRQSRDQFKIKYWLDGGVETITLKLDGAEHPWFTRNGWEQRYRAHTDRGTLYLDKDVRDVSSGPTALSPVHYQEQWSLRNEGRQLVISAQGNDTVFQRAPWGQSLFAGSP